MKTDKNSKVVVKDTKSITEKQRQALQILKENPGISAGDFAEKMWPENPMHREHSNGGNGCQPGKAGWLCGGSYLGKLIKKGLAKKGPYHIKERGFYISRLGTAHLEEFYAPHPEG